MKSTASVGLDVHQKTISYCLRTADERILAECSLVLPESLIWPPEHYEVLLKPPAGRRSWPVRETAVGFGSK